jgi:DNA-directed RNA polymerase specialized sigma24 family protein
MALAGKKKRGIPISVTASSFDEKFLQLKENIVKDLSKGKKFSDSELLALIKPVVESSQLVVPISIFKNKLSTLEVLSKYLVEYKKLHFFEIASLLKRNQRTIWGAYHRAKRKKVKILVKDSEIKIPISIFANRKIAPLQVLVCYLKERFLLGYSQIARLLNLDPRTVWVTYNQVKDSKHAHQETEISEQDILKLIKPIIETAKTEFQIPVSIFHNKLSTLESLIGYLTAYKGLKFFEIAHLLKRNQRTIWGAYHRAKRKRVKILAKDSEIKIPLSIFSDRNKAPLQALVLYLKDKFLLSYSEIARLLNLDPRTVWVTYRNTKKK